MGMIIKKGFKLIVMHLMTLALTFFFTIAMGYFVQRWGFLPVSVVMMPFYFALFYQEGWKWGRVEGKPYHPVKATPLRALAASVVPGVVPAFFIIASLTGISYPTVGTAQKLWYFAFIGFFEQRDFFSLSELLIAAAVMPAAVTAGYWAGMKNFVLFDRLFPQKKSAKKP